VYIEEFVIVTLGLIVWEFRFEETNRIIVNLLVVVVAFSFEDLVDLVGSVGCHKAVQPSLDPVVGQLLGVVVVFVVGTIAWGESRTVLWIWDTLLIHRKVGTGETAMPVRWVLYIS